MFDANHRGVAAAILAGALSLVAAAQAQGADATVSGTVRRSADGAPLAGVEVALFSSVDNTVGGRAITAGDGRYTIAAPAGSYRVHTFNRLGLIDEMLPGIACPYRRCDPAGATALYDAIVTGLYRFRTVQGRKALVVITDGEDTSSRLSYDDMLGYARASRVPLYFIGIGFTFGDFGGAGRMKSLAAETGGVAYIIGNVKQLPETYRKLEADLRSQYLLTYRTESSKNDTAYRTIEVKVDKPDARVRTIRGFIP